jgi:DNA-binding SARP family transcriptional activator/tetratricopeptide (TPR) repeat protein
MAHLTILVLGTPQIALDNIPVSGFISDKARALLLYLAVEQQHPFRREALAALLWPEQSEQHARGNLRRALANVRRIIGDADGQFLHVTRQELQFNILSDSTVDLTAFLQLLHDPQPGLSRIERAAELVQGAFLSGFSIGDSVAFEEWVLVWREQVHRRVLSCLSQLTLWYETHHEPQIAMRYATQQTALDPWYEPSQRQLMRLLAHNGQRSAALRHYEQFAETVSAELSIEPEPETRKLYEQIRDQPLATVQVDTPRFLAEPQPIVPAPFVSRTAELARLDDFLSHAVAEEGCILFVTGEAGSGKTRLLHQFAQRAQRQRPDLIPLFGACHAHVGAGDPYLPIRMLLSRMAGDIRTLWYDGTLNRQQVERMWELRATAVQLLQTTAPDCLAVLIDRMVLPEAARPKIDHKPPTQDVLFQQLTRFLQTLSEQGPLLLLLDDLQWADSGTIDLLFHLRRQLVGFPILIVGAYRPEEVAAVQPKAKQRHPLAQLIQELRRDGGDIELSLDRTDGRAFVDEWLDTEPNCLDEPFRRALYRKTRGHALFTVELVAGMQERGELTRDQHGYWQVGTAVSWHAIPARVDAIVAQRIGRLSDPARRLLTAGCILGETFAAEIAAQIVERAMIEVIQTLSGGLGRIHRLVEPLARLQVGRQTFSPYRFRHALYRQYLYERLDRTERAFLHQRAGEILEQTYLSAEIDRAPIAAQLAWHFETAENSAKSIHYRQMAGDYALRLSAHRDAIGHMRRGLALIARLPQSAERTRQEIDLQIKLGSALVQTEGYGSVAVKQVYERVHALCQQGDATPQLVTALFWLTTNYAASGQLALATHVATQMLAVSERISGDDLEHVLAHTLNGLLLFLLGNNSAALPHLQRAIELYNPAAHQSQVYAFGQDPGIGAMIWQGHVLLHMGRLEQAQHCLQQALEWADALDHPYTRAFALLLAGCTPNAWYLHHPDKAISYARETITVAEAGGFTWLQALATFYLGFCAVRLDGSEGDGFALMEEGLRLESISGNQLGVSSRYILLADAHRVCGQTTAALQAIARAEQTIIATDERYFSAELYRLKGQLYDALGDKRTTNACCQHAIEIARTQHAALWEQRALLLFNKNKT